MRKQNKAAKFVIPALVIFSIIAISNGGFGSGGYGNLFLQPTMPNYPSNSFGGFGSFGFMSNFGHFSPSYVNYGPTPAYFGFNYVNNYQQPSYNYQSSFNYQSAGMVRFQPNAYTIPTEPIYTTPSTGLFNVNYVYTNAGKLW